MCGHANCFRNLGTRAKDYSLSSSQLLHVCFCQNFCQLRKPNCKYALQISYFRVSEFPINGIQTVLDRGLILAASADTNVYFYQLDGGLIGIFGVHIWNIHDISTYQDVRGLHTSAPLDDRVSLYEAAKLSKEPGAAFFVIVVSYSWYLYLFHLRTYQNLRNSSRTFNHQRVRVLYSPSEFY